MGGYSYEPTAGSSGPDQLYQLRRRGSITDRISFSQLLAIYPLGRIENRGLEGIGIGLGPTLFRGGDSELFKQWNLRLMYETPWTPGLLLTLGLSWRWLKIPEQRHERVVSVPRSSAGAGATEPSFATKSEVISLFSLGFALDLALLGDAATELTKAVEGKGK